jgi:hypothetical protein
MHTAVIHPLIVSNDFPIIVVLRHKNDLNASVFVATCEQHGQLVAYRDVRRAICGGKCMGRGVLDWHRAFVPARFERCIWNRHSRGRDYTVDERFHFRSRRNVKARHIVYQTC